MTKYILKLSCKDSSGIVATVSGFIANIGGFIIQSGQFGDESTNKFFMRAEFESDKNTADIEELFKPVADKFNMDFCISDMSKKPKILIAVTTESHCLLNLLHKHHIGALNVDIVGVISNRENLKELTEKFNLEFNYLPIDGNKADQEQKILEIFQEKQVDLLVLARYMQILSADFCDKIEGKAINIHHSFLPGFKGAKPYHQAYDRGVKIIGATAHYVTKDLDEGPIIEQEVTRVNHAFSPDDLKISGQDIESRVLYKAVKWHTEQRIIINNSKTVIF